MESMLNMEKVIKRLPIVKSPITQHSNYAVPLSIILAYDNFFPWYMQNFVQVFSADNIGISKFGIYYNDNAPAFHEVMEISKYYDEEVYLIEDIIHFVKKKLNTNIYVELAIDSFYIKGKNKYRQRHVQESCMIFGYDDFEENFFAFSYNSDLIFSEIRISYVDVQDAFFSIVQNRITKINEFIDKGASIIRTRTPKKINTEFDIIIFISYIEKYLFSEPLERSPQLNIRITNIRNFGINSFYDLVDYILYASKNMETIRYHDFHILWEHKKELLKRFEYVNEIYLKEMLNEEVCQFKELVKDCNEIRFRFLKNKIRNQKGLYCDDYNFLLNIRVKILNAINKEKQILNKLFHILTKYYLDN